MSASLAFRAISSAYVAIEAYKNGILLLSLVVSYGYSSWVLGLDGLQLLYTSQPAQIAVALLGLALFPSARARLSLVQGSSTVCSAGKQNNSEGCTGKDAVADANPDIIATCTTDLCSSSSQTFRLARPPFIADLSYGVSSYSCTSNGSSNKTRRRRLPRVSLELTPLPRLSLEFQHRAHNRSNSRSCLDTCSLYSPGSKDGNSSGSRWHPSMSRIMSGHDLQALQGDAAAHVQQMLTAAPWSTEVSLQDAPTAGEATESLGHGALADGVEQVGQVINETHLLQVGAMLGEPSSRASLVAREAGGPVGHPSSFYGSEDTDSFLEPWDLLVSECSQNVLYWAWRRPLRKGLYMYMTRSVFLDTSPAELRAFMNDDVYRVVWDSSMAILRPMAAASLTESAVGNSSSSSKNASVEAMAAAIAARTSVTGSSSSGSLSPATSLSPFAVAAAPDVVSTDVGSSSSTGSNVLPHESAIMQALVHFPKPMASRSYIYARRVWDRPSDGGCYCLSKSCTFNEPLPLPCRAVAVEDYVAGCVIRTPAQQLLPSGAVGPAAEVLMVYYEDSHVRPGLANLGIKKGLWPLVQKTEKALRVYQAGAAANMHLQTPQPHSSRACSLQSSRSTPNTGLSRASSLSGQGSLSSFGVSGGVSAPCSPEKARREERHGDDATSAQLAAAEEIAAVKSATVQIAHSDASATCCAAGAAEQQKPDGSKAPESSSRGKAGNAVKRNGWDWWHMLANTIGSAIKGSGQLVAAASVALWRSHTRLALMVPSLEWRLLYWVLHRLAAPAKLLPGAPAASGSSNGCSGRLQAVSSHPIGDCLHPGLLQRLRNSSSGPTLLRVSSHPIVVEDVMAAAEPGPCQGDAADDAASACSSSSRCGHRRFLAARSEHCSNSKLSTAMSLVACKHAGDEVSASSTDNHGQQQLLQYCSTEPALSRTTCVETASVVSSHTLRSMDSTCCQAARHAACCSRHALRIAPAGNGDETWSRTSSVIAAQSSCGACGSCNADVAATWLGCSASCCGSCCRALHARCSSRNCNSMCEGSSRVSGDGRRQRRVVLKLVQAASVRVAHKLLSALETGRRE